MSQKIEQWMRDASIAICKAWDIDSSAVEWGAEIIASQAPSGQAGVCVVDEWGPREGNASPSPYQSGEAAAQPKRYQCCGADFAKQHEPHCHNYKPWIEHNDH